MLGPLPNFVAPARQHTNLDIRSLEGLVQSQYAKGIADSTRSAYSTAQHLYLTLTHLLSTHSVSLPPISLIRDCS